MPIYRVTFKDGKQETVSADSPEQARRRIMEMRRYRNKAHGITGRTPGVGTVERIGQ